MPTKLKRFKYKYHFWIQDFEMEQTIFHVNLTDPNQWLEY